MKKTIFIAILLFGFSVGVAGKGSAQVANQLGGAQVDNPQNQQTLSEVRWPDFTFKVHVSLKGIHQDVTTGRVNCVVKDANEKPLHFLAFEADFPIPSNGMLEKDVVVTGNVDKGEDPSTAENYYCILVLKTATSKFIAPATNSVEEFAKVKPGTPITIIIEKKFK